MSYGYVYLTRCPHGCFYVGQHGGSFDPRYTGSGTLIKIMRKNEPMGIFSAEQVEVCASREDLDKSEEDWIAILSFYGVKLINISRRGALPNPFGRPSTRTGMMYVNVRERWLKIIRMAEIKRKLGLI